MHIPPTFRKTSELQRQHRAWKQAPPLPVFEDHVDGNVNADDDSDASSDHHNHHHDAYCSKTNSKTNSKTETLPACVPNTATDTANTATHNTMAMTNTTSTTQGTSSKGIMRVRTLRESLQRCTTASSLSSSSLHVHVHAPEIKKTKTSPNRKRTPCVKFQNIHVREYEIVPGCNPSITSGPPVELGWRYNPDEIICSIDIFENFRLGYGHDTNTYNTNTNASTDYDCQDNHHCQYESSHSHQPQFAHMDTPCRPRRNRNMLQMPPCVREDLLLIHGNEMRDILSATKLAYITKAERESTMCAELMKKKMDVNHRQKKKRRRSSKEKLLLLLGMKTTTSTTTKMKKRTPTTILKSIR